LVSLARVAGLTGIITQPTTIRVGAGTAHAAIATDATLRAAMPEMARVFGNIGYPRVRQWGTVGGNIAARDSRHDGPTFLTATGATASVEGADGQRTITVSDLNGGVPPSSVITAFHVPRLNEHEGAGFDKLHWYGGDFDLVNAGAVVELRDDRVGVTRAAVGGTAVHGVHAIAPPAAALCLGDTDALDTYAGDSTADLPATDDMHGSRGYKLTVAAVALKRAIRRAAEDARRTRIAS
jgi:carbon-monoxide dehydrogenase medium subunit